MENKKDILKDYKGLKSMPYTVPEGYFDSVKSKMRQVENPSASSIRKMISRYSAAAAVVLMIGGGFIFTKLTHMSDMSQEDYLVFSDGMMNTMGYEIEYGAQVAEAEIGDDALIDYLIYIGVTPEEIELSK